MSENGFVHTQQKEQLPIETSVILAVYQKDANWLYPIFDSIDR